MKVRLSRRKLRKIHTVHDLEHYLGFSADKHTVFLNKTTFKTISEKLKDYNKTTLTQGVLHEVLAHVKTQMELSRIDFQEDNSLRNNRIIIKNKNEVK